MASHIRHGGRPMRDARFLQVNRWGLLVGLLLAVCSGPLAPRAGAEEDSASGEELLAALIPGESLPEDELEGIYGRGVNLRALAVLQQGTQETFAETVSTTVGALRGTRVGEFRGEVQDTVSGTSFGGPVGASLRRPSVDAVRRPVGPLGVRAPATTRTTTFRSPNGNILGGGAQLRGVTRTPAAASSIGLRRGF